MRPGPNINFEYAKNSDEVMKFIGLHWRKKHILSSSTKLFDWQYKSEHFYNFIVAKDKNKIVGVLGFIPNTKYDPKIEEEIIWLALWKVIEEKKYLGVGIKLLLKLINEKSHSIFAVNGIEENVLKIYQSLGFKISSLKHFYILNPKIKSDLISNIKEPNFKINKNLKSSFEGNFEKFSNTSKDFFIKFNKFKSNTFVNKRYNNNPFYDYLVFHYKSKTGLESLIVMRKIYVKGENILRVIDFIGDKSSIKYVARFLFKIMLDNNYSYVDFLADGIEKEFLLNAGFCLASKDGTYLPNYFEPFSSEFITINTAIKIDEDLEIPIFKGDGDQDRPNLIA